MAKLPNIQIDYQQGALGQSLASSDGLLCLVVCGLEDITPSFSLSKLYALRKLADIEDLGMGASIPTNALLYNTVSDFYAEAQEGTKLYVIGYPAALEMSDVLNKDNPYARTIVEQSNGEIRGLIVTKVAGATPVLQDGLDADMPQALLNAQGLGDWATAVKYAPIFTLIDGVGFSGDAEALVDLSTLAYNRVGVVIGSQKPSDPNQSIGLVGGRIASSSVDNNVGRVLDGALHTLKLYAGATLIENSDVETINEKSYITFRTFTGKSGYFISDDYLATSPTDDYNQLTHRRTIDKAYRMAYAILLEQLLNKIAVKSDGTMQPGVVAAWEAMVENGIARNMTANGELSADDTSANDKGVICTIDPTQNVLSTSKIEIGLRVRPFGYARYIVVHLGFTVVNS